MFAKIPTTKNSDILTSVSANPSLEKKYMSIVEKKSNCGEVSRVS